VKSDEEELKEEVIVSQSTGYYKEAAENIDVYVRGVQPYLQIPSTAPGTEPASPDPRALRKSDLSTLVIQNTNLTEGQKDSLFRILEKYVGSMTTKPGKCNFFTYKFHVESTNPSVGYARPIPFSIRPAVRQQIQQMMEDGILELSNSPIINPLTVVQKEGKKVRICVDARKVNACTIPDRERTPPLPELLQVFSGTQYMTSLDLSSAYLQIELHEESRKYTAFLFDSTVYQYKRVSYGFRNSLSAFVRALKLALGGRTEGFVEFIDGIWSIQGHSTNISRT
jgi:hypothetical protein